MLRPGQADFFGRPAAISAQAAEIDARVYRLYGLTDEEIKIVEGAGQA